MTTDELVKLYRKMLLIRAVEDRLQSYCDQGLAGDLHFNKGQEAIAVGVCAALTRWDRMVTHHRTIAHQIARGAELEPLIAELLGKRTGVNGGRAGEMHISDDKIEHAFSFQLVGTCIPVAAGLAWALKNHHKTDDVVAVFFGDATSSNGQFHEGLNIAAIHELPLLLVCENNHLAGNITPNFYQPQAIRGVSERISGYGIRRLVVDGNNLEEVIKGAEHARKIIRQGGGPYLLECMTERLCWHKQGQRDIRSKEELAALATREPLARLELQHPIDKERMLAEINSQLDNIFQKVESDDPPDFTD